MLGCTFGEKKIVINDSDPWANDGENIYTIIEERGLVKISIGSDGMMALPLLAKSLLSTLMSQMSSVTKPR